MTRRAVLTAAAAAAGVLPVAACADENAKSQHPETGSGGEAPPQPPTNVVNPIEESLSVGGAAADLAAIVSTALLASARVAVLSPDEPTQLATAAALAATAHWPVLVGEPGTELPAATAEALSRLGVEHLVVVVPGVGSSAATTSGTSATDTGDATGPSEATTTDTATATEPGANATASSSDTVPSASGDPTIIGADGLTVHLVPASDQAAPPEGVPVGESARPAPVHVLLGSESQAGAAAATAQAFGAATHTDVGDPRDMPTVYAALREESDRPLIVLAADDATAQRLLVQGTMAQRAPELPGGGVTCFPHRRMVALYGHPGAPVLGLLGEQGIDGSVRRVNEYVERYSPLVEEQVTPSWEIIASVATGAAGDDGNYSKVWEVEKFRPWVDAAKEAGIYVVLDLQPGRSDFLTQAKQYEELLLEPHVGLALDPEWRLGPDERHLVRIGHVEASEVNAVIDWLATLVRENDLPQKVLTLHQFRTSMIRDRDLVRTDHPEIAVVLHADGQGGQGDKQATWRSLKQDLPEGMWLGWKNFYDEDSPMLTPEQTIAQVEPTPWFISYQ